MTAGLISGNTSNKAAHVRQHPSSMSVLTR